MAIFGKDKNDNVFEDDIKSEFISSPLKMDLVDDEDFYYLYVEIPGRKIEDIKMKFVGEQLSIRVIEEADDKNPTFGKGIIHEGRFHDETISSIRFENQIDKKKVEAKLKDGLLSVKIKKVDPDEENEEDLINILT